MGATVAAASFAGCQRSGNTVTPDPGEDDNPGQRPIVFVHGFAGSATQFESQAMRFASNGYSEDYLNVFEYNSPAYGGGAYSAGLLSDLVGGPNSDPASVHDALDAKIDEIIANTDADQVALIGHSLGTKVSTEYMNSDPSRVEKVAQYVNLDGFVPDNPPDVDTLAVWGMGNLVDGGSSYQGAKNVEFPTQTHVEVATSEETFGAIYEFFTGEAPDSTRIAVEPADQVTISGRGQLFPWNNVPQDRTPTLDVYEIDPATGERVEGSHRSVSVSSNGEWGPLDVDGSAFHEFVVSLPDTEQQHHHYRQPELRSNQFVRLLTSLPGEGIDRLIEKSDGHSALIVLRDKEWWGDQGQDNDALAVDGTNVINKHTAPQGDNIIAPFVFDNWSDGKSDLGGQITPFGPAPFVSGIDQYVPAASPADGTIEVTSTPRDGQGLQRDFAVPNYASSTHRISLYFPDHTQTR